MQNDVVLLIDGPSISSEQLGTQLGWELKPEGLCRDDVCVLVPDRSLIETGGRIDAIAVADLLDRPSLIDPSSGVAAIGAQRSVRRAALNDLQAPDFVLPDLDGTPHALSDHRSKKRLLVAFSSW
jgi:hypothetical protein